MQVWFEVEVIILRLEPFVFTLLSKGGGVNLCWLLADEVSENALSFFVQERKSLLAADKSEIISDKSCGLR